MLIASPGDSLRRERPKADTCRWEDRLHSPKELRADLGDFTFYIYIFTTYYHTIYFSVNKGFHSLRLSVLPLYLFLKVYLNTGNGKGLLPFS